MYRKVSLIFSLLSVFGFVWYMQSEQFVEKRRKKGPSRATLEQDCCQGFADVLKQIPQLLRSIAQVQQEALGAIEGYWQGDKEAFCSKASRQKLSSCNERLIALKEKVKDVLDECGRCVSEIRAT